MNQYEDYNPQIFYSDDPEDGDNIASIDDSSASGKARSKRSHRTVRDVKSRERQAKKTQKATDAENQIAAFFTSRTVAVVTGIILAGLAAFFLISFVSYIGSCLKDQSVIYNHPFGSIPEVSNRGGEGGARLSEWLINGGFGLGAFVVIIWLTCIALRLLIGKPKFKPLNFTIKCLIGFITLSLIVGLITIGSNTAINWGGYHGRYVNEWIIGFLGWWGAVILCIVMIAIFVAICMRDIIRWIIVKKRILDEKRREFMEKRAREKEKEQQLREMQLREEAALKTEDDKEPTEGQPVADVSFDTSENPEEKGPNHEAIPANVYELEEETDSYVIPDEEQQDKVSDNQNGTTKAPSEENGEENSKKEEDDVAMVVNVNQIAQVEEAKPAKKRSLYQFPSLDLLVQREQKISVNPDEQLENKERIRKTLMEFGIPIVSIEATVGPTVTLYEIRPDKGQRVAKIKSLVDDISMSLAAIGVRIIAPIPGKGTVGIEVANKKPQTVSMRTLLQSRKYKETTAHLPLALGSTISNEVYIADLASIPHLLVGGATGQGKSVGLNVILSSLLYKKRPDELKFVLFDPKMVEFNLYAAIEKQYLAKLPDATDAIITDMSKVVPTLNSLCIEMDDRYSLLKAAEVRKIDEYNKLFKKGELDSADGHRYLPYIVVVVDEFSDLIMTAGKEVEMPIARLAQKARAVGIHVIIATQRPSTAVITGNIKTNFPGRIAFKVSSGIDSKVILDATGAQQLIGKGDMLILNNSEMVRVQCAFIDTPEVKAICEHISKQPYDESGTYILPAPPELGDSSSGESSGFASLGEKDPLYEEIKNYVISSGSASTSNIQRRFGLGYNRAGRIMDQLEEEGIVGPSQGGKARSVLI